MMKSVGRGGNELPWPAMGYAQSIMEAPRPQGLAQPVAGPVRFFVLKLSPLYNGKS